jgi:hypothetical protein
VIEATGRQMIQMFHDTDCLYYVAVASLRLGTERGTKRWLQTARLGAKPGERGQIRIRSLSNADP